MNKVRTAVLENVGV